MRLDVVIMLNYAEEDLILRDMDPADAQHAVRLVSRLKRWWGPKSLQINDTQGVSFTLFASELGGVYTRPARGTR